MGQRSKQGFPQWLSGKEYTCNAEDLEKTQVQSLGWEDPWSRKWQPTPVFSPGKSHGQRSLAGFSPWGHKESDTTKQLNNSNSNKRSKRIPYQRNIQKATEHLKRSLTSYVITELWIKTSYCVILSICPTLYFPHCVLVENDKTVLYVYVSTASLKIGSSVPSF